ncbi:MAG: hypothetical protein IKI21_08645, partial [Oscillospiraceae bacterium]|nr:hypothetical protein [Oscillospiraceae bacterium]
MKKPNGFFALLKKPDSEPVPVPVPVRVPVPENDSDSECVRERECVRECVRESASLRSRKLSREAGLLRPPEETH